MPQSGGSGSCRLVVENFQVRECFNFPSVHFRHNFGAPVLTPMLQGNEGPNDAMALTPKQLNCSGNGPHAVVHSALEYPFMFLADVAACQSQERILSELFHEQGKVIGIEGNIR